MAGMLLIRRQSGRKMQQDDRQDRLQLLPTEVLVLTAVSDIVEAQESGREVPGPQQANRPRPQPKEQKKQDLGLVEKAYTSCYTGI